MPNKINYQKELDKIISALQAEKNVPRLLLHSCCAPCSSYVLEYLSDYFYITVLYYNPNISPREEYEHRKAEQIRLIKEKKWKYPVSVADCGYENDLYEEKIRGLENEPEGGARCGVCFEMRLERAAQAAVSGGFDYFTTTLSISPLKSAERLNKIGESLAEKYGVKFLPSDFKKREGYKRSIELSREYSLYRQNYCGCKYSKNDIS